MKKVTQNPFLFNPIKGVLRITEDFQLIDALHVIPHNGIDIGCDHVLALAPAAGMVFLSQNPRGGLQAIIQHNNGYRTGFAHLSRYLVSHKALVSPGQPIAVTGATGHATGPHLHFTVTDPRGIKVNPSLFFPVASP